LSDQSTVISVIVPVYEAKDTLGRCMSSLIDESLSGLYEVILVDDGSHDGSTGLCDSLAKRYPSIVRVFHQKNAGVSAARNTGIDAATGSYLSFVDSDDYVADGYIQSCLSAVRGGEDFILFDYIRESSTLRTVEKPPIEPNDIESARSLMLTCESNSPWSKLYKRSLTKGVRFPHGQGLGEDLIFNLRYLVVASSSVYIPDAVYTYVENENSRTASEARLGDRDDYENMLRSLLSFCTVLQLDEQDRARALSSMRRVIANYAARLSRQGIGRDDISDTIGGIEGIQEIIDAPALDWKDIVRRIILSFGLYSLAGLILRGK
jgi:glycosyltransferase involved in cell wall biosynthesis